MEQSFSILQDIGTEMFTTAKFKKKGYFSCLFSTSVRMRMGTGERSPYFGERMRYLCGANAPRYW